MGADLQAVLTDPTGANRHEVDPTFAAGRFGLRPLDHGRGGGVLGHYRAVTFSGACASISAAGILASLRWADPTKLFVLMRLAVNLEVLTAITTAPVFDVAAFVFRGASGNASGSGSSTATLSSSNNKLRGSMGTSLLTSGEIRTIGTTTALTAASGKTNDAQPFGAAFCPALFGVTATGTAVLLPVGSGPQTGWQDLYSIQNAYQHPLVLAQNEGIEIQTITANNASGTVKYGFLWEWAELNTF